MPVLIEGSRKLDMSHNWKVFHPNGKHMFTTSKKKADWYLNKNAAVIIDEFSIQLTYIPKGEGFADNEIFGLTPRINQCVVCGTTSNLTRHHVVPYHYRKFMPLDYKSRNHHDVVLVCRDHHEEYEQLAKPYKTKLATQYNVKTIEELNGQYIDEVVNRLRRKFKLSKLLKTLLTQINDLPIRNVESICNEIKEMSKVDVLNMDLETIEKIHSKLAKSINRQKEEVINADDYFHGNLIVKQFKTHEDFEFFIKNWRRHFVETMKPKFLPLGWSINWKCSVFIKDAKTDTTPIHKKSDKIS